MRRMIYLLFELPNKATTNKPFASNNGHITQLRGMASTLRMRTAVWFVKPPLLSLLGAPLSN